jgi:hypothetical protein
MGSVYKTLVGKHDGKEPHGGSGCRLVDNIKMDPEELGCENV